MKNRTALMLLELLIMLLVFLLAAALCLRAFAWADTRSAEGSREDMALLQLQNAAEVLKAAKGDFSAAAKRLGGHWDGNTWQLQLSESWEPVSQGGSFILRGQRTECETAYLGRAQLILLDGGGKCLGSLPVCWQEVAP